MIDLEAMVIDRGVRVVSTDLFDTILLRDRSTQLGRLRGASRRAAAELAIDPKVLTKLRWRLQTNAYRAVNLERPTGEASLRRISVVAATALGMNKTAAGVIERCEIDEDIEHLTPHRARLRTLADLASRGTRVIAVSDTYYSELALRRILDHVVGPHPLAAVYSSCDIGLTKHSGALYPEVAQREGVPGEQILHMGDHLSVDVHRAEQASWYALHLPRSRSEQVVRRFAQLTTPTSLTAWHGARR